MPSEAVCARVLSLPGAAQTGNTCSKRRSNARHRGETRLDACRYILLLGQAVSLWIARSMVRFIQRYGKPILQRVGVIVRLLIQPPWFLMRQTPRNAGRPHCRIIPEAWRTSHPGSWRTVEFNGEGGTPRRCRCYPAASESRCGPRMPSVRFSSSIAAGQRGQKKNHRR